MNQEIELRHLRYYVAVAEELHFGRAARRLHLSQPPLSQQIQQLERILGYPLLVRTSRAVRLTNAGEVFLDRARRTLRTVREDVEEARRLGRGEAGTLRVGFISSAMLTALPALLGEYRRRFPQVNLQLQEAHSSQLSGALRDGTIDAAILRDGDPADGIRFEVLSSEPYIAVLPADHPLATRQRLSTGALRQEKFVSPPSAAGRRATAKPFALCQAHGFEPQVVQEAPQWLTILRLVGAGLGVTIAPRCVAQLAGDDVACRPLRAASVRSDIELACRTHEDRAIVLSFVELARERLRAKRPAH